MELYRVTLNGVTVQRHMSKAAAYDMAERWQGSHCSYHGSSGLLKIKDRGDHVEVKRDYESEQDVLNRLDEARRGNPQKIVIHERID